MRQGVVFLVVLTLLLGMAIANAVHKTSLTPLPSSTYGFERAVTDYQRLEVKAYGNMALDFDVVNRVGGVLFQGAATPMLSDGWWLRVKRFFCDEDLMYHPGAENGQRFSFSFACSDVILPYTDEFFAPIIEFVASEYTAAVTLLGHNNNPTRQELARREELGRAFIVQYHSAFKDTLVGNMLLLADAAFVDPQILGATELWQDSLQVMFPGLPPSDAERIEVLIKSVGEAATEECPEFDSYIIVDVDTKYTWTIQDEALGLGGDPYYSFWCRYPAQDVANHYHKLSVQDAFGAAPDVYNMVIEAGRAAAFLRWYRSTSSSSGQWQELLVAMEKVSIEGHETPGFWEPFAHNADSLFNLLMRMVEDQND